MKEPQEPEKAAQLSSRQTEQEAWPLCRRTTLSVPVFTLAVPSLGLEWVRGGSGCSDPARCLRAVGTGGSWGRLPWVQPTGGVRGNILTFLSSVPPDSGDDFSLAKPSGEPGARGPAAGP